MCGVPLFNVVLVFLILLNPSIRTVVTFEISEDLNDPTAWSNSKFSIEDELMDPTGWNYDRTTKTNIGEREDMFSYCDSLLKGRSENTEVKNSIKERPSLKSASDSKNNIAFVRRFINLLLDSANLINQNNVDQDILHGLFEIKINVKQYERLIRFSESRENISFGELDSILSNTIYGRNAIKETLFEDFIDKILYVMSLTQVLLPLSLVFISLFLLITAFMAKSIPQFLLRIFIVIFFATYIFEFYTKYKTLEIEQRVEYEKHQGVPSSCSAEQSVWGTIVSWFKSRDDCVEYHKAILIDPLYKVSPLGVLSCVLTSIFTHPAHMVGGAIADFWSAIFGLPIYYSWMVGIFTVMIIIVLIVMAFMHLFGGSIHLGNLLAGVTISSSKTPLIASAPRLAPSSSSPEPLPQISSVNGSGKYILMEANALKCLLAADKAAGGTNRIEELEHHVMRSKSVPAELAARSDLGELLDSESLPQKETDLPTKDEDECIEEKPKLLSKSKSFQESSLSQKTETNVIDDRVKNE